CRGGASRAPNAGLPSRPPPETPARPASESQIVAARPPVARVGLQKVDRCPAIPPPHPHARPRQPSDPAPPGRGDANRTRSSLAAGLVGERQEEGGRGGGGGAISRRCP